MRLSRHCDNLYKELYILYLHGRKREYKNKRIYIYTTYFALKKFIEFNAVETTSDFDNYFARFL